MLALWVPKQCNWYQKMLLLSIKLPISFGYIFSNEEKFNCLIFSEASLNYLSTFIAKNGFRTEFNGSSFFPEKWWIRHHVFGTYSLCGPGQTTLSATWVQDIFGFDKYCLLPPSFWCLLYRDFIVKLFVFLLT